MHFSEERQRKNLGHALLRETFIHVSQYNQGTNCKSVEMMGNPVGGADFSSTD